MTFEFNGKAIETNENGYLENLEDWSEDLATHMAQLEGLELTEKHWDLIKFLRDEYFNNNQNQPNNRQMLKAMGKIWGVKVENKMLFDLFPGNPSKQAGRVAGLPESRRKGGY